MTFQVAGVKKAQGSVIQMVKNGNKLVFDQDSSGKDTSYIQNKRTNEKIWLRQENDVYVLLQPFDENLVDEEEQRGDRVEENEDIQDDDQEERKLLHKEKELDRYLNPASQSAGGSRTRTDAHPLPQLVCTLRARSREIRCASQTSKTG